MCRDCLFSPIINLCILRSLSTVNTFDYAHRGVVNFNQVSQQQNTPHHLNRALRHKVHPRCSLTKHFTLPENGARSRLNSTHFLPAVEHKISKLKQIQISVIRARVCWLSFEQGRRNAGHRRFDQRAGPKAAGAIVKHLFRYHLRQQPARPRPNNHLPHRACWIGMVPLAGRYESKINSLWRRPEFSLFTISLKISYLTTVLPGSN